MALFSRKSGGLSAVRKHIGESVTQRLEANPSIKRAKTDAAQVYYHVDFLSPATCTALVRMIDANRRPSSLLSNKSGPSFRTSESCDMDRWSPEVQPIDESIANLLGIDPVKGETMQGQRYAPGQQFRAHHDFFHEGEEYWAKMKTSGGQRTWTAMIFLNEPEAGGETAFPRASIKVSPRTGNMLVWNNLNIIGEPNYFSLHEGMPVTAGVKYIITKWHRERPWAYSDTPIY